MEIRGHDTIHLTRTDENLTPQEIEQKAAKLAYFLRVPIEDKQQPTILIGVVNLFLVNDRSLQVREIHNLNNRSKAKCTRYGAESSQMYSVWCGIKSNVPLMNFQLSNKDI